MKTITLIILAGFVGGTLCAQDFAVHQKAAPQPEKKAPQNIEPEKADGAVQRVIHFKNPFQAINPLAAHEYGSGSDFVYYDATDPNQNPRGSHKETPKGIKLFNFVW